MRWKGLRLDLIALTFILGLSGVLAAGWGANRVQVEQPLIRAARQVAGVRQASVVPGAKGKDLVVELGATSDFRQSYQQLSALFHDSLGTNAGKLVVKDNRDKVLEQAFYDLNFALQEGIATGHYQAMHSAMETQAAAMGLARPYVFVDTSSVFIGLNDGKHWLYNVVPRAASLPAGEEGKNV